jgi:glycine/D-amino acid oxidase-like deaminating enzyme
VRSGATVLATNSATASFPGYRLSLAVASSHIVLTEPIPDVLDELGWTGGEAIVDSRTLVHYTRTTRDGRIVFGWGGGRMGMGGAAADRLELDRSVVDETRDALVRFFPQTKGRAITHAWGGPIDVSPTHLPIFGSRGRVHHGYGFTGNGVGPSYLGGEILARLALDRRDERTGLAIVDPPRKLFPPEPFRYAGGSLIRRALMAKDAAEDSGRRPGAPTRLVASLPRKLGLRLPR